MRKRQLPIRPEPLPDDLSNYPKLSPEEKEGAYEKALSQLLRYHYDGLGPMFICGSSRAPKTSLAREVAWELTKRCELKDVAKLIDKTYLLHYCESIRNTIEQFHIPGYVLLPNHWDATDMELSTQRYSDMLRLLRSYTPEGSIFILADVDSKSLLELQGETEFEDLLSLGTVIITSQDTASIPQWVIPENPAPHLIKPAYALNAEEQIILQNASLLPDTGMNTLLFLRSQGRGKKDTVLNLITTGLLTEAGGARILPGSIPYSGRDEDYADFLAFLHQRATSNVAPFQVRYGQICQCFKKAAYILQDKEGLVAECAAGLFKSRGDYIEAFSLYEKFLAKQQELTPPDAESLARAMSAVGSIHSLKAIFGKSENRDSHFQKAKKMLHEAMRLQEAVLPSSDLSLEKTRMSLAQLLAEEGNYSEADSIFQLALADQINANSEIHPHVAQTYLDAASIYYRTFAERKLMRQYTEKALAILERCEPDYGLLAEAYSMMENCLYVIQTKERIDWEQKALALKEKYKPWGKHEIYNSHVHLAFLAKSDNDYGMQAEELAKAIQILEEMVPQDHTRILQHRREMLDALAKTT